ncbi:hypothetical protein Ancab_037257 [Ancistrocladus abbreviatus]
MRFHVGYLLSDVIILFVQNAVFAFSKDFEHHKLNSPSRPPVLQVFVVSFKISVFEPRYAVAQFVKCQLQIFFTKAPITKLKITTSYQVSMKEYSVGLEVLKGSPRFRVGWFVNSDRGREDENGKCGVEG